MNLSNFRDLNFKTRSNWIVFTGAPCSGKTAVINHLEKIGYRVIHEAARKHINNLMKAGQTLSQIKSDLLAFERHILKQKVTTASQLPADKRIFFDRGIPDSIAYYSHENLPVNEAIAHCYNIRYEKVFMFEPLPFKSDAVRSEYAEDAERLHHLIEDSYKMLGYDIITVPVSSIGNRASFILSKIY